MKRRLVTINGYALLQISTARPVVSRRTANWDGRDFAQLINQFTKGEPETTQWYIQNFV